MSVSVVQVGSFVNYGPPFGTIYVGFGIGSSNPVTAGNRLFLHVFNTNAGATTSVPTDNQGNVWTLVARDNSTGYEVSVFTTVAGLSAPWVGQFTTSSGNIVQVYAVELSGVTSLGVANNGSNAGFGGVANITFPISAGAASYWNIIGQSAPAAASGIAVLIALNLTASPNATLFFASSSDGGNWANSPQLFVNSTPTAGDFTGISTGLHTWSSGTLVTAPPPISTLSVTCPSSVAAVGVPYSSSATGSGGTPPYTAFAIVSGSLPPGLSLNAATGLVSGIPTTPGTYPYAIRVTDSAAGTATSNCSIRVTQILQAQLAFQGVRRLPRIGPAIDDTCDYDERTFTYPLSGVIGAAGPATSPLTLTQAINDYDFDLYQLMFFYTAATPLPPAVCTAWVYDYARNAISNIPVLDSILNGAPGSKYQNGALLPRLRYRQNTSFRIDLFNQTAIAPINVTVLLVGRQRYPKGPQ